MDPGSLALEARSLNHWATREIPALESWGLGSTGPGVQAWGSSFLLFGCLEPPSLPHLLVFLDTDKSFHIPLCSPCHCPFRMLFLLNLSWSPPAPLLKGTVGPCLPWFPAPLSEFLQCPLVAASLSVCGCQQQKAKRAVFSVLLPLHPISPLPSILWTHASFWAPRTFQSLTPELLKIQACRPLILSLFTLSTLTCPLSLSVDLWQMKRKWPL